MPNPIINRRHKKRNAVAWTPIQLPNLWAWYRSDQGVTAGGGGEVLQWADITGSGRDLVQGSDPEKPILTANEINGHSAIIFDGVDDYMKTPIAALAPPMTVFIIFSQITWTAGRRIYDTQNEGRQQLFQNGASPAITQNGTNSTNMPVGTFALVTATYSGASDTVQVNNNAASTGGSSPAVDGAGFTLGAYGNTLFPSNISVAEVIIMTSVADADQMAAVQTYVTNRYGISM